MVVINLYQDLPPLDGPATCGNYEEVSMSYCQELSFSYLADSLSSISQLYKDFARLFEAGQVVILVIVVGFALASYIAL